MVLVRALMVAASLALAAASPERGAQGRYFPGLPTPLAPFIDFYEMYLEPEELFINLKGASRTWAFVTFSVLMLAANMGYLPFNPAELADKDFDKFKPFGPVNNHLARSIESQQGGSAPLSSRLPFCLPLLLCSMERSGWTGPLPANADGSPGLVASLVQRWVRPTSEEPSSEGVPDVPEEERHSDPCWRFREPCAVPLLNNFL